MNDVINYKSINSKKKAINQVLFVNDSFNISKCKKFFLSKEFLFVTDLLKSKNLKKKFISLELSSKKKIILVSIKKDIKSWELENLGGKFFQCSFSLWPRPFIIARGFYPRRYISRLLKVVQGWFIVHSLKCVQLACFISNL